MVAVYSVDIGCDIINNSQKIMESFTMQFPNFDPVLVSIGPLKIHWYGIAYVVGILLGWWYCAYLAGRPPQTVTKKHLSDFVTLVMLGIIIGGRLGHVLFYGTNQYLQDPLEILYIWHGGMSFHGGLVGVVVAALAFAIKYKIPKLILADILALATPIGLFFGRIANFINGELYGRVTDSPLGMVFPNGGPLPRHPSQLYEAFGEGILLFVLLFVIEHTTKVRQKMPGLLCAIFLIGYSIVRSVVELYRQPDANIGFLIGGTTMGQLLSLPVLIGGIVVAWCAVTNRK